MKKESWRGFRKTVYPYDRPALQINSIVDQKSNACTLVDSGCLSYGMVSEKFVLKHQLQRIPITPIAIEGYDGPRGGEIKEAAKLVLDEGAGEEHIAMVYILPHIENYDIILGLPWMVHRKARLNPTGPQGPQLEFANGTIVRPIDQNNTDIRPVSAHAFQLWKRKWDRREPGVSIFAASMKDIEKALQGKKHSDPRVKLPHHYHDYLDVFDREIADRLPPHRGPQVDHRIELIEQDEKGNRVEPPWGPLYNMSREELLVLRKTLTDYLDKGFIRVSRSSAAAPVLFAKKPGGGLRFCVDYRALNKITKKDRYPLPLIHETLERISKAQWFTKLDIIAAFHKIRMAEGQEWMTAFRTRFGLFEWLVTPFGLAGAPSTFQRYINWTLRDFLDDFASAYLDDILIFTSGSRSEHRQHVRKVLERLRQAGLQLDIDKCEFEVQSTKYLGFIVDAGKGVRMDPEKIKAILEWERPKSTKGVRSFLGFANFYRQFIRDFSGLTAPLTDLTKKEAQGMFNWSMEADAAFNKLKEMFTTAPILVQFDPKRETVVEADSSGYATGGVLSQYDDEGLLRPCAYFSRKNSPAECNYEIHDKELLAIICCLKEWESELISVPRFTIITDHRNLQYFTSVRRLNERQMRWADILSRYDYTLEYRPGKLAIRPDALSRREQDMPRDNDERLRFREKRLFDPERLRKAISLAPIRIDSIPELDLARPGDTEDTGGPTLDQQWEEAEHQDRELSRVKQVVKDRLRRFPSELQIKINISECSIDEQDRLLYRNRRWVPNNEPLRTRLMQEAHDSPLTGHPGKNTMYAILARRVYWPNMTSDVQRYVRNCDRCGANTVWRTRRQGLLKPLPIPERKWREIAVDFVEKLPTSNGCRNMMVVTDRLSKGTILIPCADMTAETAAQNLIRYVIAYHGIPAAITSDRGSQFVGDLWSTLCYLMRIRQRLSTAFHPETDGQDERMNATVKEYLRNFCNRMQNNWVNLLPMAQLAINGRDATATGISPFFLDHGYHVEPLELEESIPSDTPARTPKAKAEQIVKKLRDALDIAATELVATQERMERTANSRRAPAPEYNVGDLVWLDLRNVRTERPSKTLDSRHAKYRVTERIGSHAYRLSTPPGIHNVFHTSLLRPASNDPFPSQRNDDYQPPAELIDGEEEYYVDEILEERMKKIGRGFRREYLVKWTGYAEPTWEPAAHVQDTIALEAWASR